MTAAANRSTAAAAVRSSPQQSSSFNLLDQDAATALGPASGGKAGPRR